MDSWQGDLPTEWHRRVVGQAASVLPEEEGVLAVWIGGSLATGVADQYSDVDVNIVVEDAKLGHWQEHWAQAVERCAGPLVLADPIGAPVVSGFALTPRWEHIDLVVHAQSVLVQPQTARVLHDPDGLVHDATEAPRPGEPSYPDAVVTLFLYLVGNLVVTLGRGELVLAHSGIDALRSQLVRLMLAERGIHKTDGQKRLNPYLDTDQQRFLTSLPAAATTSDDILVACQVITVEFVRRARRLAQATDHPFPTTLLRATVQHLRRHVGGTWSAPPAMDA